MTLILIIVVIIGIYMMLISGFDNEPNFIIGFILSISSFLWIISGDSTQSKKRLYAGKQEHFIMSRVDMPTNLPQRIITQIERANSKVNELNLMIIKDTRALKKLDIVIKQIAYKNGVAAQRGQETKQKLMARQKQCAEILAKIVDRIDALKILGSFDTATLKDHQQDLIKALDQGDEILRSIEDETDPL